MAQPELAAHIEARIEEITTLWIETVRIDPYIQCDAELSNTALRDHVPAMIEEICDLLRSGETPNLATTREARVHTYVRFRQGYRARELVRELALLRMILINFVAEDLFKQPIAIHAKSFAEAIRQINLYIDEEMRYAVSIYLESVPPVPQ